MKRIKETVDEMIADTAEAVGLLGGLEGSDEARVALRMASAHLKTASAHLAAALLVADAVEDTGGEAPEDSRGAPLADAAEEGGETVEAPPVEPEASTSEDVGGSIPSEIRR